MSGPSPPSILLLQVRGPEHDTARRQELVCFRERAGAADGRITALNLVTAPTVTWEDLDRHDVLLIGGAGSHTVTREYDFTAPLAKALRRWVEAGRPLLGSCWGHQFLAWILGGTVITDPVREEVGTFDVHLTEAGRRDPLLAGLPDSFPVHLGHHDVVSELPPGMVELAYSDLGRHQIVRLEGLPIYGTQFHCEMTRDRMYERLRMYGDEYLGAEQGGDRLDRMLRPTPEAEGLLCRFLALLEGNAAPATVVESAVESIR